MENSSPGDMLKAAREKARLEQNRVATEINVSVGYIAALEKDDTSSFPSLTYYKGFLRMYADYLGIDFQVLSERVELLFRQRSPLPGELLKKKPASRLLLVVVVGIMAILVLTAVLFYWLA